MNSNVEPCPVNTDLLTAYIKVLQEPSVPANRVTRKVAVLTAGGICALVYYRHGILGFGLWEPAFVTVGLAFFVAVILGIFGGLGAGAFYEAFLRRVGASSSEPSVVVFFAEWLFAATATLIGLFIYALVNGGSYAPW
jgi:hypothetical protein